MEVLRELLVRAKDTEILLLVRKALFPGAWLLRDLSPEEGGGRGEATEEVVSPFPVFRQVPPVRGGGPV